MVLPLSLSNPEALSPEGLGDLGRVGCHHPDLAGGPGCLFFPLIDRGAMSTKPHSGFG